MAARRPRSTEDEITAETIEACRRGDRHALELVFRAEAPHLRRLIAALVGPGLDIEDILQATLLAAIDAFPRFRAEATVRTWLTHIAVRIASNQLRQTTRRRAGHLALVAATEETADPAPQPDAALHSARVLRRIYEHLDRIEPKKRVAFLLHVVEGYSIEEVAALTGASRVLTRARVYRARRAILRYARRDPALRELLETS